MCYWSLMFLGELVFKGSISSSWYELCLSLRFNWFRESNYGTILDIYDKDIGLIILFYSRID